jgi:glycosyltransferase involved in cell wall biosynthesis
MRILHVNNLLPVEPLDGGRIRKLQHIDVLSGSHEVWVVGRAPVAGPRDALIASRPGTRFAVVPESSDAGRNPVPRAVRELAAAVRPDVIHVSGFPQWPGERAFRDARVVLDIDSLDAPIFARMRSAGATGTSAFDVEATEALTRSACARADLVLACSEVDAGHIRRIAPTAHVRVVENALPTDRYAAVADRPPLASPIVTFTGLLGYWPNADACAFFVDAIWPRVLARAAPAVFRIVGRVPPTAVVDLTRSPSVELHADVEDILPWFEASRVMVAPIRAGSGTRLKILEAFAAGRPVVSTSIGCEGLDVVHGEHLFIADDPDAFAECVVRLLQDAALWRRLATAALALVRQRYDVEVAGAQLRAHYEMLSSSIPRGMGARTWVP